ncbi:unnamed protein product, partial [Rotaria socialis]
PTIGQENDDLGSVSDIFHYNNTLNIFAIRLLLSVAKRIDFYDFDPEFPDIV